MSSFSQEEMGFGCFSILMSDIESCCSPSLQYLQGCLVDRMNLGVQGDPISKKTSLFTHVVHK